MENGVPARRRVLDRFDVYEAANLQLFRGDFFALTPALLGEVAAVYDRAALISWTEELRVPYVAHLAALRGRARPCCSSPWSIPRRKCRGRRFQYRAMKWRVSTRAIFEIREIDRQDILANEPRLRARGVTELVEVCYQMVRL